MARGAVIGSRAGTAARQGFGVRGISSSPGDPNAAVNVQTDMGALCTRLATEAADAVVDSFTTRIQAFLDRIRKQWPRKTGYSEKQFSMDAKTIGLKYMMVLGNAADYSGLIRKKEPLHLLMERRKGNARSPQQLVAKTLILDAADLVANEIARDIADSIGD